MKKKITEGYSTYYLTTKYIMGTKDPIFSRIMPYD